MRSNQRLNEAINDGMIGFIEKQAQTKITMMINLPPDIPVSGKDPAAHQ